MTWTPERHAAVKARCNTATEGPWGCYPGAYITSQPLPVKVAQFEEGRIRNDNALADSAFIAGARTDLPDALAEIERLQTERHRLRLVLITINAISGHRASCPHCVNNRTTSYQALEATT